MRIFVAGATGVIGRSLVPQLLAAGHTVTGTSSTEHGTSAVKASGLTMIPVEIYDGPEVMRVVQDAAPDVIID